MEQRYLSIGEVARRLDVSDITVRRWVKSGKLDGSKAGVQWRFDPDTVDAALASGLLEGASRTDPQAVHDPILDTWREYVQCRLGRSHPHHVVVNDRRGAKMWDILNPGPYKWGIDLWHSTAIEMMTPTQTKGIFGTKRVLLFDEMMQHGADMNRLRVQLEDVGAEVSSLVCIRSRSHAEVTKEYLADACEDLPNREFNERATFISKLVRFADPPLDVDHLVVRARLKQDFSLDEMLVSMMRWGMAFPVWDEASGSGTCAVTLDRPQFFDTANCLPTKRGFRVNWSGPNKIRFYVEPTARSVHCVFVTHPEVSGSEKLWQDCLRDEFKETISGQLTGSAEGQQALRRAYRLTCMHLSIALLRDFVSSGAAGDLGLSLGEPDSSQLRAIYGPDLGRRLTGLVKTALEAARKTSIPPLAATPPPLLLRTAQGPASYDAFGCRAKMLTEIKPPKADEEIPALPYGDLFIRLAPWAESTVSRVLDSELDAGTVSPHIAWDIVKPHGCPEEVRLKRAYYRGEYRDANELRKRSPLPHAVAPVGRMLLLGPFVMDYFLTVTGRKKMTVRDFNDVFVNLGHDLEVHEDSQIGLAWRPSRLGPVPTVSSATVPGESMRLDRFLYDPGMLMKTNDEEGSGWLYSPGLIWSKELLAESGYVPQGLRTQIGSLVWFYGEVQKRLPQGDILGALASVRTPQVAYKSGWYHFDSWRHEGLSLVVLMGNAARSNMDAHQESSVAIQLKRWVESVGLLRQKLDAFRRLPELKGQIETAFADVFGLISSPQVLAKVDPTGKSSAAEKDIMPALSHLETAQKVMQGFTSFTMQMAAACGVDCSEALEAGQSHGLVAGKEAGQLRDELFTLNPELRHDCSAPLAMCVEGARQGILTSAIAEGLGQAYESILRLLLDMIPLPKESRADKADQNEAKNTRKTCYADLLRRMDKTECAVAVVDLSPLARRADGDSEWAQRLLDEATENASQTARSGVPLIKKATQIAISVAAPTKASQPPEKALGWNRAGDTIAFTHVEPSILLLAIESFLAHIIEQNVALRAGIDLSPPYRTEPGNPQRNLIAPAETADKLAHCSQTPADAMVITQNVWSKLTSTDHKGFQSIDIPDIGPVHWRKVRQSLGDPHSKQGREADADSA